MDIQQRALEAKKGEYVSGKVSVGHRKVVQESKGMCQWENGSVTPIQSIEPKIGEAKRGLSQAVLNLLWDDGNEH